MDTLSAVITAIISGVVASAKPTAKQAVVDLYGGLKALIQRKYSNISLESIEKKPDSQAKQDSLRKDLAESGATEDKELIEKACMLLKAIDELPTEVAQTIGIKLEDVKAANLYLREVIVSGEHVTGAILKHVETTGTIDIGKINVNAGDAGKK